MYQKILSGRGMQIDMQVRSAAKNDIEDITDVLYDIFADVETDEQVVVDISGGDESTLVAVGMILGSCSLQNRQLYAFRINVVSRRGVLFEMKPTEGGKLRIDRQIYDFSCRSQVYLTVEENITLHGGRILAKGVHFAKGDAVSEDVRTLWELCRADCTAWNTKVGQLAGAVSAYSESNKLFMLPEMSFGSGRYDVDRDFWNALVRTGLVKIDEKRSRDGSFVFSYKNQIVRECLNKAGSVLEYLTYLAGLEETADGASVFDDAELSVVIDWDSEPNGTSNEIDCIFMHGMVPVFVSCKNGDVKTDELYKLEAVADKFGSGYAKTALVSTVYFDPDSRSYDGDRAAETLRGRAEDMQIRVFMKVHRMTAERLGADLAKLIL